MHNFTPISGLVGGILIGSAAAGLLFFNGRIAGISNIFGALIPPSGEDAPWRLAFVAGLLAGGVVLLFAYPVALSVRPPASLPVLAVAGLLVGFGASVSNGCTSGHGVCGLGRRSVRSLSAVVTFMTTGVVTVYVVNHLLG
jgi:uncharacterized membrane protein YedE/YeeE